MGIRSDSIGRRYAFGIHKDILERGGGVLLNMCVKGYIRIHRGGLLNRYVMGIRKDVLGRIAGQVC